MRPGRRSLRLIPAIALAFLIAALAPASASARKPLIAYVEGGQFKLYDAEIGADVAAPPIPVHAPPFRFAISRNGRYVFFDDAANKLHLYDRDVDSELSLPNIDVYPTPGFLTVSDGGLLAFDNNSNGPALVYDSATKQFVSTGFPADNKNRQTQLSPGGGFLITTCDDAVDKCPTPTNGSDPFLQDLTGMTNLSLGGAVDAAKDEEHPCISNGAALVGWDKTGTGDKDIFLYDRNAMAFLATTNLNDPNNDDTHCSMDAAGEYVALTSNNAFALYEVASDTRVMLPAKPFETNNFHNQILSAPFTPSPKPMPASPAAATTPARKKCKRKKHKGRSAAAAKKKHCKKKKKRR